MDPTTQPRKRPLSPKKLLLSKWTAVHPQQREKHFLVCRVHDPRLPEEQTIPKDHIELEAVLTKRRYIFIWRELQDCARWRSGWH